VQNRLAPAARRWDCNGLTSFAGAGAHESVIANGMASSHDIDAASYTDDPDIFGTSMRGLWTVDIRQTLATLGTDDGCFAFDAGPLPQRCYPSRYLSPCFDTYGNRLQGNAPQFCGCYDAAGNLFDTTSPGCSPTLPSQLTFLNAANAPDYRGICSRYLDSGQLQRHGDEACCTQTGLQTPDLSAAALQTCDARGLGNDTACRTPDVCYEICGPRCKAFKNAFAGFEYAIYWRARR
jgi:hypothetical protein